MRAEEPAGSTPGEEARKESVMPKYKPSEEKTKSGDVEFPRHLTTDYPYEGGTLTVTYTVSAMDRRNAEPEPKPAAKK